MAGPDPAISGDPRVTPTDDETKNQSHSLRRGFSGRRDRGPEYRSCLVRGWCAAYYRRHGGGRSDIRISLDNMSDSGVVRGPSVRGIPEGDNRERMICSDCGYILYDNPKIVVGSVPRWGDRILMCRRAIHPRRGFWTLPAGYLELNESTSAGAEREAWEEAQAKIQIEGLLAIYDIPRISQVQLIYRALLLDDAVAAGPESLEVALFRWDEIPWDDLAFPSVRWALHQEREAQQTGDLTTRIAAPASAAAAQRE
jgi:ADP-ribose pyrophosphatase YjhB (NUDIX family)